MYIEDEKKASLRLEIWREIMRRDPREHRQYNGITQGLTLGALATPNDAANQANAAFAILFPEPATKPAAKKRKR